MDNFKKEKKLLMSLVCIVCMVWRAAGWRFPFLLPRASSVSAKGWSVSLGLKRQGPRAEPAPSAMDVHGEEVLSFAQLLVTMENSVRTDGYIRLS